MQDRMRQEEIQMLRGPANQLSFSESKSSLNNHSVRPSGNCQSINS